LKNPQPKSEPREVRETFLGLLIGDVIAALERMGVDDSQAARRNLIRTMFAAIEGLVWELREHVRSIAKDIGELPALTELALTETSYAVSNRGEIVSQQRFLPLSVGVRLATLVAQQSSPALTSDFGARGWSDFNQSIIVRHRVTHPKTMTDLKIDQHEIDRAKSALAWLMRHVETVMRATLDTQKAYLADLNELADALIGGDPVALAQYREAMRSLDG
jgi:hypothetical protein